MSGTRRFMHRDTSRKSDEGFSILGLKGGRGPGGYPSTDNFKSVTHTFEHRQTLGFDRLNPEIQKMIGKQRSKVYFLGLA